jgi:methyl-accepting chemotaxis protein
VEVFMASDDSNVAKIQTRFQELSSLAASLNTASDELTKVVSVLDESLKKLNVGLTVWVTFRFRGDDNFPEEYDVDQIGYAKVNGTWGLALRNISGDHSISRFEEEGPWLFKDGPREFRVLGVEKILEVVEALAKSAADTTKRVQEKTKQVRELATALEKPTDESKVASAMRLSYKLAPTLTMKLSDLAGKGKEGGK